MLGTLGHPVERRAPKSRRISTLLALTLATGACSSRAGGKVGTVFGGGFIGVGVLMEANAFGHGGEVDPADVAVIPIALGVLILIPSLLVWIKSDEPAPPTPAPPPTPPPPPDPRLATRERAWQLTKQAAAAARGGDCGTVARLDVEVRSLDAEVHDVVFARDVAIAACLSAR